MLAIVSQHDHRQSQGGRGKPAFSPAPGIARSAPAVIVLMHTQHYKLLQRNLLYTAITRGKRLVLVVGSSRAVAIAIKANQVRERRTTLKERLKA